VQKSLVHFPSRLGSQLKNETDRDQQRRGGLQVARVKHGGILPESGRRMKWNVEGCVKREKRET
jgi:hypothetical protein